MDPLRYRACVGHADCGRTKGMGEPVENAVLDGVQVASEVCASPPPGAIADEKQLDLPLGELISNDLAYPTVFSKAFSLTCRGLWMKTSTLVITPDQGIIGFTVSK